MNSTILKPVTDATSVLVRFNKRTGAPYRVWVTVLEYSHRELPTREDSGCPSEIEDYHARTSLGAEIQLTDEELATVLQEYESNLEDGSFDHRI